MKEMLAKRYGTGISESSILNKRCNVLSQQFGCGFVLGN
jgi:hypothetical protein